MDLRILTAAMMASLALAGCVSDADDTPDDALAQDMEPTFQGINYVGGKYVTGFGGTEPTLGIDATGAVFMTGFRDAEFLLFCAPPFSDPDPACATGGTANAGAPIAVASFDQGQTWVDLGPDIVDGQRAHRETLDPYLYVDPITQRVYLHDLVPGHGGQLSWTDDQGETWFSHAPLLGNPQVDDHQTLVASLPRGPNEFMAQQESILTMCVNNVASAACTSSYDGGLTWTPQVIVEGSEQSTSGSEVLCSGQTGHLKASPTGRIYLPSVECPTSASGAFGSAPSNPVVYISEDNGLGWRKIVISDDVPSFDHETSIAVDDAGNVYAFWIGYDDYAYLARSDSDGYSWSDAMRVSPETLTATTLPALAAGGEGQIAFSYAGTTVEGGNSNQNATRGVDDDGGNSMTWNTYMGVIQDAWADELVIETVATNDVEMDPLVRGNCALTRCPGTFDFHDLWIDDEGRPWASWVDACEQECNTSEDVGNNAAMGFVATIRSGPSLRGDGMLVPLDVQAVVPGQEAAEEESEE